MKTLQMFVFAILMGIVLAFSFQMDAHAEKIQYKFGKIYLQPGQIGKVIFVKETNIYKTSTKTGKEIIVKKAKAGEEMGVYALDKSIHDGVYILSGKSYVKTKEVKYKIAPADQIEIVGKERIWITDSSVWTKKSGSLVNIKNLQEAVLMGTNPHPDIDNWVAVTVRISGKDYEIHADKDEIQYLTDDYYLTENPYKTYSYLTKHEWKLIKERTIEEGMSWTALRLSWGSPERSNSNDSGSFTQYVYGEFGKSMYVYYVYIADGEVVSIDRFNGKS
jgi:hypothetical protein